MPFKGDMNLWALYAESIQRMDRSNIMVKPSPSAHVVRQKKSCDNPISSLVSNIKKPQNLNVYELSRNERKKFVSRMSIDLHGKTRHIEDILERFCAKCILRNIREITIITGKGNGILKDATLNWISRHPEFVTGFFPIIDSMGESGAFAVRLRSMKRAR